MQSSALDSSRSQLCNDTSTGVVRHQITKRRRLQKVVSYDVLHHTIGLASDDVTKLSNTWQRGKLVLNKGSVPYKSMLEEKSLTWRSSLFLRREVRTDFPFPFFFPSSSFPFLFLSLSFSLRPFVCAKKELLFVPLWIAVCSFRQRDYGQYYWWCPIGWNSPALHSSCKCTWHCLFPGYLLTLSSRLMVMWKCMTPSRGEYFSLGCCSYHFIHKFHHTEGKYWQCKKSNCAWCTWHNPHPPPPPPPRLSLSLSFSRFHLSLISPGICLHMGYPEQQHQPDVSNEHSHSFSCTHWQHGRAQLSSQCGKSGSDHLLWGHKVIWLLLCLQC